MLIHFCRGTTYGKTRISFQHEKIDMCCNVTCPFEVYSLGSSFCCIAYFIISYSPPRKVFHGSLAKRKSFLERSFLFSCCLLSCINSFSELCLHSCHRVCKMKHDWKLSWHNICINLQVSYEVDYHITEINNQVAKDVLLFLSE